MANLAYLRTKRSCEEIGDGDSDFARRRDRAEQVEAIALKKRKNIKNNNNNRVQQTGCVRKELSGDMNFKSWIRSVFLNL